jgi:hypothetical protein
MGFSRKRGRPSLNKEKKDTGTKELREKIIRNLTIEPLDLCLKKKLISSNEHKAGIRLRWLYTLRFGSPGISAYHPENQGPSCFRSDDESWLAARHSEYTNMLSALEKIGAKRVVMNICVFNQHVAFLTPPDKNTTSYDLRLRYAQYKKFQDGLDCLAKSNSADTAK